MRWVPHLLTLLLALASSLLVLLPHLLGWRADVEALSGNVLDYERITHGVLYTMAWLQWVVLAPALTAGGLLGLVWEAVTRRRDEAAPAH